MRKILIILLTIIYSVSYSQMVVADKIAINGNWLYDAKTGDTIITSEYTQLNYWKLGSDTLVTNHVRTNDVQFAGDNSVLNIFGVDDGESSYLRMGDASKGSVTVSGIGDVTARANGDMTFQSFNDMSFYIVGGDATDYFSFKADETGNTWRVYSDYIVQYFGTTPIDTLATKSDAGIGGSVGVNQIALGTSGGALSGSGNFRRSDTTFTNAQIHPSGGIFSHSLLTDADPTQIKIYNDNLGNITTITQGFASTGRGLFVNSQDLIHGFDENMLLVRGSGATDSIFRVSENSVVSFKNLNLPNITEDTTDRYIGLDADNNIIEITNVHGTIYMDSVVTATTFAVTNTWYIVTGWVQGEVFDNITFSNDTLYIDHDGTYKFDFSGYSAIASISGSDYEIGLSVNGELPGIDTRARRNVGGSNYGDFHGWSVYRRLNVDDYIVMKIIDLSSTRDITLTYGSLSITKVN